MLGLDKKDLIELSKTDKVVLKYMEEVERVNENPEFREYISYEEEQRKIRNTLISEARKNGIEQEKLSIAKKLLDTDMDITQISQITEIPEEKIREMEDTN